MIYVHVTMPNAQRQARGSYERARKEGRNMGHQGRTGALLVTTAEGILGGSGARRTPDKLRWSATGWDTGSMGCGTETEGKESSREDFQESRGRPREVETEELQSDIDDLVNQQIEEKQVETSSSSPRIGGDVECWRMGRSA